MINYGLPLIVTHRLMEEMMKKTFSICEDICSIGCILALIMTIYTFSYSDRFCVLFAIILVPFTCISAYGMFILFKMPAKERPKPTRHHWTIVHHPITDFASLAVIQVMLPLHPMRYCKAVSYIGLVVMILYLGVLAAVYIWEFRLEFHNRHR
jgi:hypothetical protein